MGIEPLMYNELEFHKVVQKFKNHDDGEMTKLMLAMAIESSVFYCLKLRFVLTFRLCEENDEEERAATLAPEAAATATDLDEVFGIGDDDGGDDDGEPVRCLRRANALLSPSVLSCNLCTFTNQLVFGRGFDLQPFRFSAPTFFEQNRL